jgi:hypothetical protein
MRYNNSMVLSSPPYEKIELVESFANAFSNSAYTIGTLDTSCRRTPDGLFNLVKRSYTYRKVLQDESAELRYFTIDFIDKDSGENCTMPIGVFGVSKLHDLCFPLLINCFWRYFLMMDKNSLAMLLNVQESELHFNRLLAYRERLVRKIFSYYKAAMSECDHVMIWAARGEKSLTRIVAESEGYIRFCMNDVEIYSSAPLANARRNYIDGCIESWRFKQDKVVSFVASNASREHKEKVNIFLSGIFNNNDGKIL